MGTEPTPIVLRLPPWSGRATLLPRAEGVPESRRRPPIVSGRWDDCFLWKDRTDRRAGLTWFDTRIAWECTDLEEAGITVVVPAKGPGRIELSLRWKGDDAPSAIVATDRWHEEDLGWFEETGAMLAKLLGLPCRRIDA